MQIDAIGSILGNNSSDAVSNSTLNQEDFLRLFLAELNFQDPLEPVDNKEFLAQLAQFSAIEQNRQTTENMESLVFLESTDQSVGLLGKTVEITDEAGITSGTVNAIRFSGDGPVLSVTLGNGNILSDIRLSQVSLVQQ